MPAVSVVVPTYQRRELVAGAVESVLAQSFRDLELIVVDDGSTDGTGEALAGIDERLRYVWKENAGVSAARNHGLALVRGHIVAFLDSDNRWLPDHLEVLVAVLERHPEAPFATTCPLFRIEGDDGPAESKVVDHWPRVFSYGRTGGFISGVAIRREALEAAGGFDEALRAGEDTDLLSRVGILGPIATVQRRTLIRGVTPTSLKQRSREAGEYLLAAERTADNLLAAAERLSGDPALVRQAEGAKHLSKGLSSLQRGDVETVRAEFEEAVRLLPGLSWSGVLIANRIWKHLPMAESTEGLLAAYTTVAEVWPDPAADAARFVRTLAVLLALRAGRPRHALRLLRAWPRGGTFAFFRRRTRSYRILAELFLEERRDRAQARVVPQTP